MAGGARGLPAEGWRAASAIEPHLQCFRGAICVQRDVRRWCAEHARPMLCQFSNEVFFPKKPRRAAVFLAMATARALAP